MSFLKIVANAGRYAVLKEILLARPFSPKWFYSTSVQYDLDLNIQGVSLQKYIKQIENEYIETRNTPANDASKSRISELEPVIHILQERKSLIENIHNLEEFLNGQDHELKTLAREEKSDFENKIKCLNEKLLVAVLPNEKEDLCNSIVLEVNTGVGGQEAMLFAKELFEMYSNFAQHKGWKMQLAEYATTDLGGIRHGSLLISGNQAFRYFKHEAGVHRVQRIPTTEKAGRIHTSTVSVLALPQPSDIEVNLEPKDLKVETKRASGAGGQHVNTTDSAVRIVHLPTNISVECQVGRSQIKNRQIAMTKLRTLLYQKQLQSQMAENQATRKSQVRSNFRNEKIRTYNFPQDRITDHRLQGGNVHNLKGFLLGGDALDDLITKIDNQYKINGLLDIVVNLNNKS